MDDFLKYEEYEDYWCFKPKVELEFSILKTIDYCSWVHEKSEIKTRIETFKEIDKPSKTQIETLHFILENQNEIRNSIFNFNQRFIYPIYEKSIDIEEEEIVHDLSQLSRVYGIKCIEIPNLKKSDSFYYLIQFDFKYDDEHGLYLLFENASVIDFFAEGNKSLDAVTIYQKGLKNKNEEPLNINLYSVPFKSVLKNDYEFEEEIKFPLKKGAYRVAIQCNQTQYCINFYVPNDLESFSLKQTLLMK